MHVLRADSHPPHILIHRLDEPVHLLLTVTALATLDVVPALLVHATCNTRVPLSQCSQC